MTRHALRTMVLALALPLAGIGLGSGCARQSEGEPCDFKGGSDDCESGLVCTSSETLLDDRQDRCCPLQGGNIRDGRCTLSGGGGSGGSGGTGGSAGTSGASGSGGTSGSAGTNGASGNDGGDASETGGTGGQDSGGDADACPQTCTTNDECGDTGVCVQNCCQACDADSGSCGPVPEAGTD